MSFKYREGQLVEITWSIKGESVGDRFTITDYKWGLTTLTPDEEEKIYKTGKFSKKGRPYWCMEDHLRLVDLGNDENSEFTFEELMLNLKQGATIRAD